MQAQTAVPARDVNVPDAAEAVPLSSVELLLSIISLLALMAFITSLIKWISLLRHGVDLFGEQALVPVRRRARPYWNPALFILFFGVLIVASLLFNGWAIQAGWIAKPADPTPSELVEDALVAEPVIPEVVVPEVVVPEVVAPQSPAPPTLDPENAVPETLADDSEKLAIAASPEPAISVAQLLLSSAAMLTATIVTLLLAQMFRPELPSSASQFNTSVPRQRPRFGCLPQRGDITLGFRAAWLILPPTMLLMGLVSILQQYSHPVLEALKPSGAESAPNLSVFAALFFTTAIITPLVEEVWFRGLLQGGLQRLADLASDARWYSGMPSLPGASVTAGIPRNATDDVDHRATVKVDEAPYASPREVESTAGLPLNQASSREIERDLDTRSDWTPTAVWPIVITSLVFAVMHWGQGLAPIPLFFLSLGLGYLYRQTGSLVPSIVVHFTLNGFTMCVTLLQLLG